VIVVDSAPITLLRF